MLTETRNKSTTVAAENFESLLPTPSGICHQTSGHAYAQRVFLSFRCSALNGACGSLWAVMPRFVYQTARIIGLTDINKSTRPGLPRAERSEIDVKGFGWIWVSAYSSLRERLWGSGFVSYLRFSRQPIDAPTVLRIEGWQCSCRGTVKLVDET